MHGKIGKDLWHEWSMRLAGARLEVTAIKFLPDTHFM